MILIYSRALVCYLSEIDSRRAVQKEAMYLCICNALTDRHVRRVCGDPDASVSDVYRELGCKLKCGRCVATVREFIKAEALPAVEEAAA